MAENPGNQWRILDAGNYPQCAAAFGAGLDIDGENALETLHPVQGCAWFIMIDTAPQPARHDAVAMLEVRGENAVEAGEVQPGAWYQCRQPGNEIQRFQHHMGRAVPEWVFVLVDDPAPAIDGQALGGDGRAAHRFTRRATNGVENVTRWPEISV